MRVLVFKNGLLTVIRDAEAVKEIPAAKPAYLTADAVCYDILVKTVTTGDTVVDMTDEDIAAAEKFITEYVFASNDEDEVAYQHCVNTYGDYVGFKEVEAGETPVESAPPADTTNHYFWDGSSWKVSMLVKADGTLAGTNVIASGDQYYIDASLVTALECLKCQTYNKETKSIVVDMAVARRTIFMYLQQKIFDAFGTQFGYFGPNEVASFPTQIAEANAYLADNNAVTPFIDALLIGRGMEETKADLVNKIIEKAAAYTKAGTIIGKCQAYKKRIEEATSVAELVAIYNEWK